jgi:Ca2+-binding RTX toxin-like protein
MATYFILFFYHNLREYIMGFYFSHKIGMGAYKTTVNLKGGSGFFRNEKTVINANGGNDRIHIHTNIDGSVRVNINGEKYDFTADQARNMVIDGGDGNDTITMSGCQLYGPDSNISVVGGEGNDVIYGSQGNDHIYGGRGYDTIYGFGGDDEIRGGKENDTIYGGTGNDYIQGDKGADTIFGGAGNDSIDGGKHDDYLNGGSGDDIISGSRGTDIVFGGFGCDTISGGKGDDYVDQGCDTRLLLQNHICAR